jgi:DNA polymerase-3 subunit delta'
MEIIGHQKQWDFLKRLTETKKISHAYLFTGQEKLGKKTLALEWTSLLFGKNLQKNHHPDFSLIEPENREIQIGQIRELIWRLSLRPSSAPLKIALIDEAHLMNQEAQTCFLKTLEEPKGKTLLILISEAPRYLFPTILSRVQTIKFYPVKKEEIKNYLKKQGVSEKEAEEISQISLGRPGIAVEFISDRGKLELFQEKIKELIRISNSPISARFPYAKHLSQDIQNLKENLDIWLGYFRDILLSRLYQGFGRQAKIKDSVRPYSIKELKNIIKQIQTTKFLILTTNINPRLALETLMLEL